MSDLLAKIKLAFRLFQAFLLVVLRTQELRRKLMMVVTLVALVMLFFGYAVFDGFLERHRYVFAIYWIFCMALVVLMLLLGIYDIIRVRRSQTSLLDDLKSIVPEDKLREISELLEQQQGGGERSGEDGGSRPGEVPRERKVRGKVRNASPDDDHDDDQDD